MFTAAVSLIALAASALLGRRELLRRKASGGENRPKPADIDQISTNDG